MGFENSKRLSQQKRMAASQIILEFLKDITEHVITGDMTCVLYNNFESRQCSFDTSLKVKTFNQTFTTTKS